MVDGIVEDIVTELSRFSELFVIARNSSFQYKGKAIDVPPPQEPDHFPPSQRTHPSCQERTLVALNARRDHRVLCSARSGGHAYRVAL